MRSILSRLGADRRKAATVDSPKEKGDLSGGDLPGDHGFELHPGQIDSERRGNQVVVEASRRTLGGLTSSVDGWSQLRKLIGTARTTPQVAHAVGPLGRGERWGSVPIPTDDPRGAQ